MAERKNPTQVMEEEEDRRVAETVRALTATRADANQKGLRRGKGGRSSLPCPICEKGELRYSVSGYNGHIHAQCSTEGCVQWMQ